MDFRKANGLREFYSFFASKGGRIEAQVDGRGNPTLSYPHVHLVHHANGQVDVVASVAKTEHPWRTTLMNPSGQAVEQATKQAAACLDVRRIQLLCEGESHGHVEYRRERGRFRCLSITWQEHALGSVEVMPRDPAKGSAATIHVGELFDFVWGRDGKHTLPCGE